MRTLRQGIRSDCSSLRSEIGLAAQTGQIVKADSNRMSQIRRLTYVSSVISLYGLLEQTIDEILLQTAHRYNAVHASYDELPTRVREEFRRLGLQTLMDGSRSRLRDIVDENEVLATLNARTERTSRRLVPSVFTRKQSNYRHPFVCEVLGRLDIHIVDERRLLDPTLLEPIGIASIDSFLSDLVERRNALAHSYSFTDEILGTDQLLGYLNVVEGYLLGVESCANTRLLNELVGSGKVVAAGVVVKTWESNIGVDLTAGVFRVADQVMFRKNNGTFVSSSITSLMLGGGAS